MDNNRVGGTSLEPANVGVFPAPEDRVKTAAEEFASEIRPFGEVMETGQTEVDPSTGQRRINMAMGNKAVASEEMFEGAPAPNAPGFNFETNNTGAEANRGVAGPALNISSNETTLRPLSADGSTEKKISKRLKKLGDLAFWNDYDKKESEEIAKKAKEYENDPFELANYTNRRLAEDERIQNGRIIGDDGNEAFYEDKQPANRAKADTGRVPELSTEVSAVVNTGLNTEMNTGASTEANTEVEKSTNMGGGLAA